jgi:hypothetical protein
VLEDPFPRYVPYMNKRKITAFLHIHWGQKTNFVAAQPFRGRVEEDRVDEAGDTTIFWRKKFGAPGLVDACCPLIIAYTTYIKLNWRPFLGAASHFSENSNYFLMFYIMQPSRNSVFDSPAERDTDLISSYILCPCSLPSVSHIIPAPGQV